VQVNSRNDRSQADELPLPRKSEAGFSLLEMVVAMVVMMIGLLALASTIGFALTVSNKGRGMTNSKLLVVSILEQMETLRNTRQLSFEEISNSASSNFGGFPDTFQPVSVNPGPDGIYGTGDDLIDAGGDGLYGTADDFSNPSLARPGMTRQILITPLSGSLKKIQVTLRSSGMRGAPDESKGVSYLNNDANSNFLP
jgi:type II secretory pathway pseudopilin PulG